MNTLNLNEVNNYVQNNIVFFHENRKNVLESYKLNDIIRKNPYLQKAKNIQKASELIESTLAAKLSSSEEKIFGDFFEGLAIFVSEKTVNGQKSAARGVDLEFINEDIHYVISIKSSTNWGNSSQKAKLRQDLNNAVSRIKQLHKGINVQPVEGICYGKTRTTIPNGILKVVGQNFWYLISENKELYRDIIEPIGYEAKKHNEDFANARDHKVNLLTKEFVEKYCKPDGSIDWNLIVKINCGNFDLDKFYNN